MNISKINEINEINKNRIELMKSINNIENQLNEQKKQLKKLEDKLEKNELKEEIILFGFNEENEKTKLIRQNYHLICKDHIFVDQEIANGLIPYLLDFITSNWFVNDKYIAQYINEFGRKIAPINLLFISDKYKIIIDFYIDMIKNEESKIKNITPNNKYISQDQVKKNEEIATEYIIKYIRDLWEECWEDTDYDNVDDPRCDSDNCVMINGSKYRKYNGNYYELLIFDYKYVYCWLDYENGFHNDEEAICDMHDEIIYKLSGLFKLGSCDENRTEEVNGNDNCSKCGIYGIDIDNYDSDVCRNYWQNYDNEDEEIICDKCFLG